MLSYRGKNNREGKHPEGPNRGPSMDYRDVSKTLTDVKVGNYHQLCEHLKNYGHISL